MERNRRTERRRYRRPEGTPRGIREDGATLVEILIVVLILGTLVSIGVPATATYRSQMAVQHAADEFVTSVSLARAYALRYGTMGELHVDDVAETFWVEVDTTMAGRGVKDTIGVPVDLTDELVDMTSSEALFCFDARGIAGSGTGCASSAATLVFTRAGQRDSVAVTPLGKVFRR